jgi:ribosomal protein L29
MKGENGAMADRRHLTSRRLADQQDQCPITIECVKKLLARLETVETKTDCIPDMRKKIDELHEKLVQARGFIAGMRLGVTSVFVLISSFVFMVYGLISGKISVKDLISGLF